MVKITIIGAGPAGISAAVNAAEEGFETILIEKESLGGVCLNRGCIPTKTLIESAKIINILKDSKEFGIDIEKFSYNLERICYRKDKIIREIQEDLEFLLKIKKIRLIKGIGKIIGDKKVKVNEEIIETDYIILAIGAKEKELSGFEIDHQRTITPTDALELIKIPKDITIIGGGAIGIEFAYIFNSLGSKVEVIEKEPCLLKKIDQEIVKILKKNLEESGIKIRLGETIEKKDIESELILIAIGKNPRNEKIRGINPEKDILKEEGMKTNIENIFIIGDAGGELMLSNKATIEGRNIIRKISGKEENTKMRGIVSCIYGCPEIASVGLTEEEMRRRGKEVIIGKSFFSANSKAKILNKKEGFVKLIFDKNTKKILGAHLIGESVTEIIGGLSNSINSEIDLNKLKENIHAHPTLSEIIDEAIKNIK